MRVRQAVKGDEVELARIFLAARLQVFTWCDLDGFRLEDFGVETAGEAVSVVDDGGGRVVGFISVWERERFVHHLYVDPEAQGSGYGTALLGVLDGRHELKCQVKNVRAYRFYLRRGWRELSRGRDLTGEYALMETGF